MTMSKAVAFNGPQQQLELKEFPLPRPRGGQVLVRIHGCTLCGSDLHSFDGRRTVSVPTVLGHEIVGEIVAFGKDAPKRDLAGQPLRVGDRVTWSIVAHCGECFYCQRGLPQKCLASVKYGHEALSPGRELQGGLAEHCLLASGTSLVRPPTDMPLAVICPASCATATISAAVDAAGDIRDRNVCILGMGLLGLTASAMVKVAGAANIICVDVKESRRVRALAFGASRVCRPEELVDQAALLTDNHGFDVVLELSGNQAAFENGWNLIRRGGTLVLVGSVFPAPPVGISLEQIVRRNLTIRGVHNYAPRDLLRAVEFLSSHHRAFPFADLVSEWLPLESVTEAFRLSHDPGRIRIGIRPE